MKTLLLLTMLSVLASHPALARCITPEMMTFIPEGATADRDEMLAGRRAFLAYHAAVQEYLDCANTAGIPDTSQEFVLRTLRATADRFNKELRAYKLRKGE